MAGLVAALVVIGVAIEKAEPDRSVVGTVTRVEPHEICVAASGKQPVCAHVDYPGDVDDLAVGDCVQLRRSGEGTLESVHRSEQCG